MAKTGMKWSIDPQQRLDNLSRGLRNRVYRKALGEGIDMLVQDVRSAVPKATGALKLSIAKKIKTSRRADFTYGLVGAKDKMGAKGKRKAFSRHVKRRGAIVLRGRGSRAGEAYTKTPAKYLYLVDQGHKKRRAGGLRGISQRIAQAFGGGRVAGRKFMERTLRSGWNSYLQRMISAVREGVDGLTK